MQESGRSPVMRIWVLAAGPALGDIAIMTRGDSPPLQAFFTLQPVGKAVNTDTLGA